MTTVHNPDAPAAPTPLSVKDASATAENTKPNNKIGDRSTVKTYSSKSDNTTQSKVQSQLGKDPDRVVSPDPDTGGLLDAVRSFFADYIVFPTEHDLDVVVLWVVHTWALSALEVSPRLVLVSPEPACGKTRVLEMVTMLCPSPELTYAPNAKNLRKTVEDNDGKTPTILVDEADAVFGAKGISNPGLRALINCTYRRGSKFISGDGEDAGATTSWGFAPFAVAGLSGSIPATITSRAVTVTMRPPGATRPAKTYQRSEVVERARKLRERLQSWSAHADERLAEIDPTLPAGLRDRAAEIWQSLLAIAELAQGSWPERARAASSAYAKEARGAATLSPGLQLLIDIRAVFGKRKQMFTEDLITELVAGEETLWSAAGRWALTPRQLAGQLRDYGVKPRDIRDGEVKKGYHVDGKTGLRQAWDHWLDLEDKTGDQSADDVADSAPVAHDVEVSATPEGQPDQAKQGVVADVADVADKSAMANGSAASSLKAANNAATPVPGTAGSAATPSTVSSRIPGDVNAKTPGQTARVEQALASAGRYGALKPGKPSKEGAIA